MISLKEYAKQKNVSYEAIRKQVARYKDELQDHITMDGKQQFLDDEAVAFLDERRKKNPVVVYQQNKDDEIQRLREERDVHLVTIAEQAKKIAELTQFQLDTVKKQFAIEAVSEQQERRSAELDEREQRMAAELKAARQEGAEAARRELEEKTAQEIAEIQKNAQEAVQEASRERDEARKKIEALESRTLADYLKGWFRKKKKG